MAEPEISRKLAVIVHADVEGSTALVQRNETVAHQRINDAFQQFSSIIQAYGGAVREIRGDALVAEFARPSDAVCAALKFQQRNAERNADLSDGILPVVRVGIALGEEVIAHDTVTGAGVVLAQRVEQLSAPGGVCVTGAIHEAIPNRMPFDQESLGEQALKGFDEPVRVYRVALKRGEAVPEAEAIDQLRTSSSTRRWAFAFAIIAVVLAVGGIRWVKPWAPEEAPASVPDSAFPLPDKPSIAVLPFANMSNDPDQEYFVDGMTEDLITDLSKISGLFVIARHSSFAYKGQSPDVRQVARELGVRYVLEGSVRRAGKQLRINAQLIDAFSGGHVWADRYDGSISDVFALQDEVSQRIVNALSVNLTPSEIAQPSYHAGVVPDAYDAFLQGWAHYRIQTPNSMVAAISAFGRATESEPEYAYAHAALAATYLQIWENGWAKRLNTSFFRTMREAKTHLQKGMNAPTPLAHWVASKIAATEGRYEEAVTQAEQAIELNPNDSTGYAALASALLLVDKPTESAELIRKAMRLDPHYPPNYLITLGQAQFSMNSFEDAAKTLERAVKRAPKNEWGWVYLAATYGHLGELEKARAAVEVFDELRGDRGLAELTLEYLDHGSFGSGQNRERLKTGLAKIPEPEWNSLIYRAATGYEVRDATIDTSTAKSLYEEGAMFVYVISLHGWWAEGRIPGSVKLEPHRLSNSTLRQLVNEQKAVIFYGYNGFFPSHHNAAKAVSKTIRLGFRNVYLLRNGLESWRTAGHPIEKRP